MNGQPVLDVRGLSTDYTVRRAGRTIRVHAVDDVSFTGLPARNADRYFSMARTFSPPKLRHCETCD